MLSFPSSVTLLKGNKVTRGNSVTPGTGVSPSHRTDASGSLVGSWDRACSNGVFYRNDLTANEAFQEFWAGWF